MRVIGIDLGDRRIGVAVSDSTGTLARPLKTLERGSSDQAAVALVRATIDELAQEDEVACIVFGLPTRLDGTDNRQTPKVRRFVQQLAAEVDIPVVMQDERLSSHEAEERLAVTEKDWRRRKAQLDAAAAAVILQDYLDGHGHGQAQRAKGIGQRQVE
jgi:putative pre-16S rRNA nuclease